MKNKLILTSAMALFMSITGVSSNCQIADLSVKVQGLSTAISEQPLDIEFDATSVLRGSVMKISEGYFVFQANLIVNNTVIGEVQYYFQTGGELNGPEQVVEGSITVSFSNSQVEEQMLTKTGVLKSRHDTTKNCIQNLR